MPPALPPQKPSASPGLAILGCLTTGTLATIGGLAALVKGHFSGAAACFAAAALAFGIVAHVSFHH